MVTIICKRCGKVLTKSWNTQDICRNCRRILKEKKRIEELTKDFPPCVECGKKSIVLFRGEGYCQKHSPKKAKREVEKVK